MPSQDSAAARVVARTTIDTLPLPLVLRIFTLLPADARLLAAAVCRSWRAMLAERSLWTRLDLSQASVVANPSAALLCAATARAGGQLETLNVFLEYMQKHDELLAILADNAGTMRELVLTKEDYDTTPLTVEALLRAAPGLRLLETSVSCDGDADGLRLLRKEPPFGPLRLKCLELNMFGGAVGWRALAAGLALHSCLEEFALTGELPEATAECDAVVGALLSLPLLRSLTLNGCRPSASVLARLLRSPSLRALSFHDDNPPLLDSPASVALLCDALRANTQLESLTLDGADLWADMDAATALLATLQTHPSLQQLSLHQFDLPPEHAKAAGAALGSLIAHAPALKSLELNCALGDAGLDPIMEALPHARHLHTLNCYGNHMSEAFVRERLLPAVRACASLRELRGGGSPAMREVKLLLQQRR